VKGHFPKEKNASILGKQSGRSQRKKKREYERDKGGSSGDEKVGEAPFGEKI